MPCARADFTEPMAGSFLKRTKLKAPKRIVTLVNLAIVMTEDNTLMLQAGQL
jgi:hypothetical protein